MEYRELVNGMKVPLIGFGTYKLSDCHDTAKQLVYSAIKTGYRLIDTAQSYLNESAVGEAVREAIYDGLCSREEILVSSKIQVIHMTDYNAARKSIDQSLQRSGLEYFDIFLLHFALGDYFSAWRALEDAYREGIVRAIGVCNFYTGILANLCETVEIQPMINQIETHPFYTREPDLETCSYYGIVPEAWSPLGNGQYPMFDTPVLKSIAHKYNKTVAQIVLHWNVQRGVVVIPKSSVMDRIRENTEILDFTLTEEEMLAISSLDMGYSGVRIEQFEPEFARARRGRTKIDFYIYYHADDSAPASGLITGVAYGWLKRTLTTADLRFHKPGYRFTGWKVFRECDQSYYVRDADGTKIWQKVAETTRTDKPDYVLYKDGEWVRKTASEGIVHFYAQWEKNAVFTICYHRSENSEACDCRQTINYGILTKTFTSSELQFYSENRKFAGWKVFREVDKKWFVKDIEGKKSWQSENDIISEASKYQFVIYKDGEAVRYTAPSGLVHFYGQWV